MEEAVLTQQLQHLDKASELLLASSPAVAAHLHAELLSRAQAANATPPSSTTRPELCPACGHFLIGKVRGVKSLSDKKNIKLVTHRSRQDRLAGRKFPMDAILECSKCQSAIPAPDRQPKARRSTGSAAVQVLKSRKADQEPQRPGPRQSKSSESTTAPADGTPSKPQTAAAKKRSRDKKSSLKALLADRNRTEAARPKGFGLSLSDFTMS